MTTNQTSKSSAFLTIVRLATVAAAVVLFAQTANADPRPGIPPYAPWKEPTKRELLASGVGKAQQYGTQTAVQMPLKNAAAGRVPCTRCEYHRPPMLVRSSGKPGR
jgi:hypothetical protein